MARISGTDSVRESLASLINAHILEELLIRETELGLEQGSLSTKPSKPSDSGLLPRFVAPHEWTEIDINSFPAILITSDGIGTSTLMETRAVSHPPSPNSEPDGEIYRRTHPLRLFCYVLDQTFAATSLARDRFELVLWRTLWKNRLIADNAVVDKQSYSSLYSNVEPEDRFKAMISGFQIRMTVVTFETLVTPEEGIADTIETDVTRFSE